MIKLTHCGLAMPYTNIDLGQHWLRYDKKSASIQVNIVKAWHWTGDKPLPEMMTQFTDAYASLGAREQFHSFIYS